MSAALRDLFLLDPSVIFLNHGSFGACPEPVFRVYQDWQRELERQPVEFLGRRADVLLDAARAPLAAYLGADLDEIIFVTNATIGLNQVARSLLLQPGDEILTSDHEYGALDYTWDFIASKAGAKVVRQTVPLPLNCAEDFIEAIWAGVTPRTRVLFLSHITSPTALIFPLEELCRRARAAGILSIVDGAHVPGQLDVNLHALGADFYSGNLHKWLCAPKGSAFLYARREHHTWLEPLVISWGWHYGSSFVTQNQWQGTRDLAPFLSVPAAIEFQRAHDWPEIRRACHALARQTYQRITALTGLEPLSADSDQWFAQMVALPLPACDAEVLKARLYDEYRIEVPVTRQGQRLCLRVSLQAYNSQADVDALLVALESLLPRI